MNRSKKILYVVNDGGFFISHRLPVAKAALRSGYEVHVATPDGDMTSRIRQEGFLFHSIPLTRQGTAIWKELQTILSLYRLYKTLCPDVVHHVTIKPVLYGSIAARLARVPAVVNAITGLGYLFSSNKSKRVLLRRLTTIFFRIALKYKNQITIFQNSDDKEVFSQKKIIDSSKAVLIKGSGVNIEIFNRNPEPSGVPLVIFASRMIWDKGVGEFVEAAQLLRKAKVNARFALVGESDPGNPAAVPTIKLNEWNTNGVIEWWGMRSDMPKVFAQSHVVCLPSYYREGVPKVLIEAAACGRPIVTTDAPGCREIVHHRENGLLIPVRNSLALADALRKLIEDPSLRRRMGARGREIAVSEFSVEKVVHETLAVYRELLA